MVWDSTMFTCGRMIYLIKESMIFIVCKIFFKLMTIINCEWDKFMRHIRPTFY